MARKNKNVTQLENEAPEVQAPEAQATQTETQAPEVATNAESPKTESTKTESTNAESKPICLIPGCGREAKIRGLCGRCCTAARAQIKKGKTTWADLERLGLATAPKKSAFGGETGMFAKALKNAIGGEGN